MLSQALRRLGDDEFDSRNFIERQLSSNGGRLTKLVAFRDAISLVMVLKGKVAQKTRQEFADIINRYIAGDLSLEEDLQANAQSTSPVAQMARESLGINTGGGDALQKKRELLDLDMVETQAKRGKLELFESFINMVQRLDPTWRQDARMVVQSKDYLKNVIFSPMLAIAGSEQPQQQVQQTISISEVAMQEKMGVLNHGALCGAGKKAKELYVAKHGRIPEQRKQFVDGAERLVNVYTEADRDIIVEALRFVGNA